MSDKTGIEWTEATWNPVTGCTKVSAGCKHCYAERDWARLSANPKTAYFGRAFTDVVCHPERLDQPLRWKRPRRIFVNSMSDLFHETVPDEFIDRVFAVMTFCPQHTFQVLTKRPDRMQEYMRRDPVTNALRELAPKRRGLSWQNGEQVKPWPRPNVWLGVSVEDQTTAEARIPLLLQTPAAVRWISAEPLLGPVVLEDFDTTNASIDWVVVGGESGPKARPMYPDWVRSLRDQCAAASVPFLFKQWGEWLPSEAEEQPVYRGEHQHLGDRWHAFKVGKKSAGRLLDGVLHDSYPQEGGAA